MPSRVSPSAGQEDGPIYAHCTAPCGPADANHAAAYRLVSARKVRGLCSTNSSYSPDIMKSVNNVRQSLILHPQTQSVSPRKKLFARQASRRPSVRPCGPEPCTESPGLPIQFTQRFIGSEIFPHRFQPIGVFLVPTTTTRLENDKN